MAAPQKPTCLPDPFEWIFIPGGQVDLAYPPYQLQKSLIAHTGPFYMAKYPVTNAQFAVFVAETGHKPWSPYWQKPDFDGPLQPVIDVFYHEAMLFCRWLAQKTGTLITLPTDVQWQRAAQGDDGRKYAWGSEWDTHKANAEGNRIWHTTPVTQYPQGASPYGVMDMCGNVEEWTLTDTKTGANSPDFEVLEAKHDRGPERIFRGGSCGSSPRSTAVDVYGAVQVSLYSYSCGIRLVTAVPRSRLFSLFAGLLRRKSP